VEPRYLGVVPSARQPNGIDIDCNNPFARSGELDGVAPNPAKGINNDVELTTLCRMDSNFFWADTVPSNWIKIRQTKQVRNCRELYKRTQSHLYPT